MSKEETLLQVSYEHFNDSPSHYVSDSDGDSFVSLRRAETSEWTAWCRGEAIVDMACYGNGVLLDLHRRKGEIVSLDLGYSEIEELYLAIGEYLRASNVNNKMVIRRLVDTETL